MKNTGFGLPIAFAVVICFGGAALAEMPYSKAVQKACAADYRAHCGGRVAAQGGNQGASTNRETC